MNYQHQQAIEYLRVARRRLHQPLHAFQQAAQHFAVRRSHVRCQRDAVIYDSSSRRGLSGSRVDVFAERDPPETIRVALREPQKV